MFDGRGLKRDRFPEHGAGEAVLENAESTESAETDEQRAKRLRRSSGVSDPGDWANAFDDDLGAGDGRAGFGAGSNDAGAGEAADPYGETTPRS